MTSKILIDQFLTIAKDNGYETFLRSAAYKKTTNTIFTISFFKSSYSNSYYINLKFDIINYNSNKSYEINKKYFSHDCGDLHIDPENVDFTFLDLELEMPDEMRINSLRMYFLNFINPLAKKLESLEKVKNFIFENKWEFGCNLLLNYINTLEKDY